MGGFEVRRPKQTKPQPFAGDATMPTSTLPAWWTLQHTSRLVDPPGQKRLEYMQRHDDTYMPMVILDAQRVVACGTLVIERKFIHQCGMLAHIEDIVVSEDQRGTGLGRILIQQLKHLAFKHGCYKITLDCDIKNEPFYARGEFETKGLQMCIYYRDDPATTPTSPKYPHQL